MWIFPPDHTTGFVLPVTRLWSRPTAEPQLLMANGWVLESASSAPRTTTFPWSNKNARRRRTPMLSTSLVSAIT